MHHERTEIRYPPRSLEIATLHNPLSYATLPGRQSESAYFDSLRHDPSGDSEFLNANEHGRDVFGLGKPHGSPMERSNGINPAKVGDRGYDRHRAIRL